MNGTNGKQSDFPDVALVPYPVIVAATKGDPDAMKIVLQHFSGYITMQTFGTAVIDHILHHIVHKVLVAYGFEKPFDCKTMPSHILSWQQSVLRSSLHHNTQLLNASIYYQTSFSHIHN